MAFRLLHIDAAHRWGGRFAFESLHLSIAVVDGVLPVNGIDFGAVGHGPFCSQGGVQAGGDESGGPSPLTAVPLSLLAASGSSGVGRARRTTGASPSPSDGSDRSIRTCHPPSGVSQYRTARLGNGWVVARFTSPRLQQPVPVGDGATGHPAAARCRWRTSRSCCVRPDCRAMPDHRSS